MKSGRWLTVVGVVAVSLAAVVLMLWAVVPVGAQGSNGVPFDVLFTFDTTGEGWIGGTRAVYSPDNACGLGVSGWCLAPHSTYGNANMSLRADGLKAKIGVDDGTFIVVESVEWEWVATGPGGKTVEARLYPLSAPGTWLSMDGPKVFPTTLEHKVYSAGAIAVDDRNLDGNVLNFGAWHNGEGPWPQLKIDNVRVTGYYCDTGETWQEVGCSYVPPTPEPSPTAVPPMGAVYGADCVYTSTTGGVTTTETIEASIVSNGSFEAGLDGWDRWQGDYLDHVTGGAWSTIGPASGEGDLAWRYAVEGDYSAWKASFDDMEHNTYLVQGVYVPGGEYRVEVGVSVIDGDSGEVGGRRIALLQRDMRTLDSVQVRTALNPFSSTWSSLSGTFNSSGGGMYLGVMVGPGEASVYFDGFFAYLYQRDPETGEFELLCPGGDTLTPPPDYVMPPIEGNIGDLPDTLFDGVELETGMEVIEGSTSCVGFQERSIDTLSLTVPGFGLCLTEQTFTFADGNILDGVIPLQLLLEVPLVSAVGWLFIRWVRGSR